ncbi:hypothetical protein JHD49_07045 [Sulfurimonas sp. SAG-AH-194-C21]|nr:hypothetical protein [Sulfurimonas sp. SAG-AH-194-C21]MDF1883691.1 hypothetical protein [Sulfurimonas sp. SAG-AH-194-C21]
MSTSIIIYSLSILLTVVIFSIYALKKKIKATIEETSDNIIKKIQIKHQTQIDVLEKKLEKYYISCKLDTLCFIGIGGGGCNIVEDISHIDAWHKFIHINSDLQALQTKKSKNKILLGYDKKEGLGCGGVAECGTKLVDNISKKQLFKLTQSFEKVYVVATLGGGVGSGSTVEIIEYLNSLDKEISVFVTMPFNFEGKARNTVALSALKSIQAISSNVTIMHNDDLIKKDGSKSLGIRETFKISSQMIYKQIVNRFCDC